MEKLENKISRTHISYIMSIAKKRDITYSLSEEYLMDLFNSQEGRCNITKELLTFKNRTSRTE
jgi:hypothetical protein